jgi:HNH endonuclease
MDFASLSRRFWSKTRKTNGCWLWIGAKNAAGYGKVFWNKDTERRSVLTDAHRTSWLLHFGPIPDGCYVCHACDTPSCVNPQHLWLGTNSDNILDAIRKGRKRCEPRTHCPQGHEFTPENTYRPPVRKSTHRQSRVCRICARERTRQWERQRGCPAVC